MGIIVDVKIPSHVRFTKSYNPWVARSPLPPSPILGQTIDRCILVKYYLELNQIFSRKDI